MYHYTYRTTCSELWQLSMYYIYGSMVGVCNVVFTAAVLALAFARWAEFGTAFRCLLVLGACLFTVLQPLGVWYKAKKQAAAITQDTDITFDERGVHIRMGQVRSDLKWNQIRRISKKPTMLVVFSDTTHGYVLSNRVLGKDREKLYEYITARMKK